jgi:hypothetical protein
MPIRLGVLAACAVLCTAATVSLAAPESGPPRGSCHKRFPADTPYYLDVTILGRHAISCRTALEAGPPLWDVEQHRLTARNYPPPPLGGLRGHRAKPFHLRAPVGRLSCRMLAADSDSGTARCRRGEAVFTIYRLRDCCVHASRRGLVRTEREGFEPSRQVNPTHAISSRAP